MRIITHFTCRDNKRTRYFNVFCNRHEQTEQLCLHKYWISLIQMLFIIIINQTKQQPEIYHLFLIIRYYFARQSGCEVLWWARLSVCLTVCLSARISPEPHARSLPIFVQVAYGRGSVILRRCCDTICTSGFVGRWDCTLRAKSDIYDCPVTSAVGAVATYCNQLVCVCLSVRQDVCRTTRTIFT